MRSQLACGLAGRAGIIGDDLLANRLRQRDRRLELALGEEGAHADPSHGGDEDEDETTNDEQRPATAHLQAFVTRALPTTGPRTGARPPAGAVNAARSLGPSGGGAIAGR
ncbi:hypothetical protein [Plantibacter sp. CFBP 13570]|uniref:hypothetical protein n=1 Tax=Plantibacter sp. CFBP 13570 TaxID=2775272 RepID=UPI001930D1E3|nr:hypothetical protein [Plantibacter sp. CFBP 13570]MBD8535926.1 hypothetical protein [Plantibacter sp. CFBP 13570]